MTYCVQYVGAAGGGGVDERTNGWSHHAIIEYGAVSYCVVRYGVVLYGVVWYRMLLCGVEDEWMEPPKPLIMGEGGCNTTVGRRVGTRQGGGCTTHGNKAW